MSIEAMKRALKTFEKIHEGCGFVKEDDLHKDAKNLATYVQEDCEFTMKTLRQAIEQAEKQEPAVEHLWECLGRWSSYLAVNGTEANVAPPNWLLDAVIAATSPPTKPWVGLNWDDIPDVFVGDIAFMQGAKWAQAKLKEKNSG